MAVKFLLDADLPTALFTGLLRNDSKLDVLRVQQVGLRTAGDIAILAFAATEERILVSKDKATLLELAGDRIKRGERMPGLLLVRRSYLRRRLSRLGDVLQELCRINRKTDSAHWENVIRFIPPPPVPRLRYSK